MAESDSWCECPKCLRENIKGLYALPLREDFDIGIRGGALVINYKAKCKSCDFEYTYSHEILIKTNQGKTNANT